MKNTVLQQLLPFEFASPAVVVTVVVVLAVADVVNKLVVVAVFVAVALV